MVYCKIYVIWLTFLCQYLVQYEYPSLFIAYLTFSYRHIHRCLNPTRNCRLCSFTRYTSLRIYSYLHIPPYALHVTESLFIISIVHIFPHLQATYILASIKLEITKCPPLQKIRHDIHLFSRVTSIHFSLLHYRRILFYMYILRCSVVFHTTNARLYFIYRKYTYIYIIRRFLV